MKRCSGLLGLWWCATPVAADIDLANVRQGGVVVHASSRLAEGGWEPLHLLDDHAATGWSSAHGAVREQTLVIALAAAARVQAVAFDTVALYGSRQSARRVAVALATTLGDRPPAAADWTVVLEATLAADRRDQRFALPEVQTLRWLKLRILDNHGDPDYTELRGLRVYGVPAAERAELKVDGVYATAAYGRLRLRQHGDRVRGCYEFADGQVDGTLAGNVLRLRWQQSVDGDRGTALLVFHPDAAAFSGLWWAHTEDGREGAGHADWEGRRESRTPGGCPHTLAEDPTQPAAEAPLR